MSRNIVLDTILVKLNVLARVYATKPEEPSSLFLERLTEASDDVSQYISEYFQNVDAEGSDARQCEPVREVLEHLNSEAVGELMTCVDELLIPYQRTCVTCGGEWKFEGDGNPYCETCEESEEREEREEREEEIAEAKVADRECRSCYCAITGAAEMLYCSDGCEREAAYQKRLCEETAE